MDIDWSIVKKKTLWQYDELITKISDVLSYSFVQIYYNHSMPDALKYSEKILCNYIQNGKKLTFINEISEHLRKFNNLGIENYLKLLKQINSKEKCKEFIEMTSFKFDALIQVLNYLFRWVLPFKSPVRELLETISNANDPNFEIIKKHRVRYNLDVLEYYRSLEVREKFISETGISKEYLYNVVHRADISRIAYVRGKTIKHLCNGGYDTLDKLAHADLKKMEDDMTKYYEIIGKKFSDFKTVIPLDWMIGGARTIPQILEI